MNENEKIKEISVIYDVLAEEIRGVKRYSLPNIDKIENGKNYKSFKKLHDFLAKFELLDKDNVRLYIKIQQVVLRSWSKYRNKVIPVNMMYNHNSMNRFIEFVKEKEAKVGKTRLDHWLDVYTYAPILEDINCLSLTTDCRLVLQQLKCVYDEAGSITVADLFDTLISIETRVIPSSNKHSVCAAFIHLNKHLDIADFEKHELFVEKIKNFKSSIKSRGKTYTDKLQSQKDAGMKLILRTTPTKYKEVLDFI